MPGQAEERLKVAFENVERAINSLAQEITRVDRERPGLFRGTEVGKFTADIATLFANLVSEEAIYRDTLKRGI